MKKFYKIMSICLVVAMFAICGCLVGCSSKPVEEPEEPNPIVVEMVDIKEFFDFKKDINVGNSLGSVIELEIGEVPEIGGIKFAIDISGANSISGGVAGGFIMQQDVNDPNSTLYFKDGYSYYTDENGQKVKVEGVVDNMIAGMEEIVIICFLWDIMGEAFYGNLEYTGVLIEKETNTETGTITYKLGAGVLGADIEVRFDITYLDGQLQQVYIGAEGSLRLTRLEKLVYPEDLDQYVEISVE